MGDIDPNSFTECAAFHQIVRTEFMHRIMMKVNYYPLKYDEFMVGQGMEFILQCLTQNNVDGIKGVVTPQLMDKMNNLKNEMVDEKYNSVGKIILYLKNVNNWPNLKDSSINAQYHVRYYYQLKCPNI